jgi:hypothetical protein
MPRFDLSKISFFPLCFFLTAWLGGTLLVGCAPFASVGVVVLMGLIDQHQANVGVSAYTIIADCKYDTIENYVACQSRKLRTHMADLLTSSPGSGRRMPPIGLGTGA